MSTNHPSSGSGSQRVRRLPKDKVIYVELDDEITSIFDKVGSLPNKEIYLMVPKKATLFQSVVNLKILKKKLADADKDLRIITNDPVGLKLAAQAEIKAYDKLDAKLSEKAPATTSGDEPFGAISNENSDDNPKRRKLKKMSIIDIVKKTRDTAQGKFAFMNPLARIKDTIQRKTPRDTKIVLVAPSRRAFSTLLIVSIVLFIFIAYFALPGATVELTTSPSILQRSVNVTLADSIKNTNILGTNDGANILATYPVSTTITKKITYHSTGQNFEGSNSTGTIKIINKRDHNWPLVKETRFQTEEGLVFRIKEDVTIPGSRQVEKTREDETAYTDTVPGEREVRVVADTEDAFGRIIGARGNIEPTKFFVPGLSKSSQNVLYGENLIAFSGGKTLSTPRIVTEDINAAKEKLVQEMKANAIQALNAEVEKSNREKNTNLKLMEDSFVIEFSNPTYVIPQNLIDQELDKFDISGEISVSGIAYNFNEVMNILRKDLKLHKSPEKRLVYIYDQSFTYDIVDIDRKKKQVKITASIKGIEEFDIDPESENGRRLSKKIKEHIVGKNKKEAAAYIQNLPEVNKVDIKTWPGWAPNLPSVPDNIKIEVVQGEPVAEDADPQ
ncbi:hypothetical protein HOG48_02615 [Candidatus Peregrinibacteria bacterium]|nr:hypothetical protein [Candidatus Peregrinibacteria bacterium]